MNPECDGCGYLNQTEIKVRVDNSGDVLAHPRITNLYDVTQHVFKLNLR